MNVNETYPPSAVINSPFGVNVNDTPVVELVAGVRTRLPLSCMMTASCPLMVASNLKVEMGVEEPVGTVGPLAEEAGPVEVGFTEPIAALPEEMY